MDNVNNPNVDNDHQLNEELTTLARDVGAVNLADDPAAQNIEAAARDEALDQIMMSKRQLEASFEMAQLATGYIPTENTVLSQSFSSAAGETTGTRAQALTRGFVANPVEVAQQLMVMTRSLDYHGVDLDDLHGLIESFRQHLGTIDVMIETVESSEHDALRGGSPR